MQLIKGKRAVYEALQSETAIDRIAMPFDAKEKQDFAPILKLAKQNGIKVQFLSKQAFDRLGEDHAQGVVAYAASENSIPIESIIQNKDRFNCIVMLDHIEDPHNMGAILRSCETLGVKAVIYAKDRQVQITPTVTKVAAGATHYLSFVKVSNLAQTLDKLNDAGYWIYGTDDQGAVDLDRLTPHAPMVLILGNEHKGVSPILQKKCHEMVRIPLSGKVSSLNVSVSAGIFLYTLIRKLS